MKLFVTGGSGFVGSAVIQEAVGAGHEVLGLARSDSAADKISRLGATPFIGSLSDLDSLRRGAEQADGIFHLAYDNNMARALKAAKADRNAIAAMAEAIVGTDKPLIITGGVTGIFGKSQQGSEQEVPQANLLMRTRLRAENLLFTYTDRGVRTMAIRLSPFVHGTGDHGFTSMFVRRAQQNKSVCYIGTGENIWPVVHRLDAARLYLLALEYGKAGSVYHAVSEGITAKQAAETVAEKLALPACGVSALEGLRRLSWFSMIVSMNTPANSQWTQKELGWIPTHPDMVSDLKGDYYYQGEGS